MKKVGFNIKFECASNSFIISDSYKIVNTQAKRFKKILYAFM